MKNNFIVRIHEDNSATSLGTIQDLTISGITLVSKQTKFGEACLHKGNQKKFGYNITTSKKFSKTGGSNNYPKLAFIGKHIDIHVENFPRYPVFGQDHAAAKASLDGWGYTNHLNKGFPIYLLYRNVEILKEA